MPNFLQYLDLEDDGMTRDEALTWHYAGQPCCLIREPDKYGLTWSPHRVTCRRCAELLVALGMRRRV